MIFNKSLYLLLTLSLLSCKGSALKINQKIELMVDGNKKTLDPTPLILSAYSNSHFQLSYLSRKDDILFTMSAYMQDLKIGSYQVYECKSASECRERVPDSSKKATFGPFPKKNMPPANLYRTAYDDPKIGLKPLTLIITSVSDEQQANNPFKTKRVKGKFSGRLAYLAYAEQQHGGYKYHVEGQTTQIDGSFDILCSLSNPRPMKK